MRGRLRDPISLSARGGQARRSTTRVDSHRMKSRLSPSVNSQGLTHLKKPQRVAVPLAGTVAAGGMLFVPGPREATMGRKFVWILGAALLLTTVLAAPAAAQVGVSIGIGVPPVAAGV